MTAIWLGAAGSMGGVPPPFEFTCTQATEFLYTKPKGPDPYAIGYDGGADWYTQPNFGSASPSPLDFTDGSGTPRTVTSLYWVGYHIDRIYMVWNGTSIPDTDSSFTRLITNAGASPIPAPDPNFSDGEQTWPRSGRLSYSPSINGGTGWAFGPENDRPWPIPPGSVVPMRLEFD